MIQQWSGLSSCGSGDRLDKDNVVQWRDFPKYGAIYCKDNLALHHAIIAVEEYAICVLKSGIDPEPFRV